MISTSQPAFKQRGFTLLEVIIAMALLAMVSIAIYYATSRSFAVNHQLAEESANYTGIAAALDTLNSDITQIYTPLLPISPVTVTLPPESGQLSDFWSAPIRVDGLRRSRFVGTREKITFVSNGNHSFDQDSAQSDIIKVTWEIAENKEGTYSLYRTVNTDAFNYEDGKITKKPPRVTVLTGLANGKFNFYRKYDKTWIDTWDSESSYTKPESRFPDLVSLKMAVVDPINSANNQNWESNFQPNLNLNYNPTPTSTPAPEISDVPENN